MTRPGKMTFRSILVGSLLAIVINLTTPYNDYVVANTFLVGSFLPLAVTLALFFILLLVNAPLHRFRFADPLTSTELRIILLMLLVSCAIPSQGLLRQLMPSIMSPFYFGRDEQLFWAAALRAELPAWLFPAPLTTDGLNSSIVSDFYGRITDGRTIPWAAWARPLAVWSVYVAAWASAMVSMAWLFRVQWVERERLPFPLTQFYSILLEPPEPGRHVSRLLRNRGFWIVVAVLILIHSTNALHAYDMRWPEIPLRFNLHPYLEDEPWRYLPFELKESKFFFTFIAIAFFMRTKTSFSMWFVYVVIQLIRGASNKAQAPIPDGVWADQHMGASIGFAVALLWIGWRFFGGVTRRAFGLSSSDRAVDSSCVWAGRVFLVALAVLIGWHLAIGLTWWVALISVALMLIAHLTTSRIVAETGLPIVRTQPDLTRALTTFPADALTSRDVVLGGIMSMNSAVPSRESLMGLTQSGLRACDDQDIVRKRPLSIAMLIGWTLVISLFAGTASHLWCNYNYSSPLTARKGFSIINEDISKSHADARIKTPTLQHESGQFAPRGYSTMLHVGVGAGSMLLLQLLAMNLSWWPVLPVGFLMAGTVFMSGLWPSLIVGWLFRLLALQFGGPKLIEALKPLVVGLIFGDALAAGMWVVISLVLATQGFDYFPVQILPT
jgi:hypothetical protein